MKYNTTPMSAVDKVIISSAIINLQSCHDRIKYQLMWCEDAEVRQTIENEVIKLQEEIDGIFPQMTESLPVTRTIKFVTVIPRTYGIPQHRKWSFTIMYSRMKSRSLSMILCGAAIVSAFATTGCQMSVGGQTLPSAYFLKDDLQYFVKGPEFKLTREAAANKKARAEAAARR